MLPVFILKGVNKVLHQAVPGEVCQGGSMNKWDPAGEPGSGLVVRNVMIVSSCQKSFTTETYNSLTPGQ